MKRLFLLMLFPGFSTGVNLYHYKYYENRLRMCETRLQVPGLLSYH